jgi:hypothetical protein
MQPVVKGHLQLFAMHVDDAAPGLLWICYRISVDSSMPI